MGWVYSIEQFLCAEHLGAADSEQDRDIVVALAFRELSWYNVKQRWQIR